MKKHLSLVIILLCTPIVWGQVLKGVVIDNMTKTPIDGAHVFVNNSKGTYTNVDGEFRLKKVKASDIVFITHIGYVTKEIKVLDIVGRDTSIYLEPNTEALSEINIKGKVKLRTTLDYTKITSMDKALSSFAAGLYQGKIYVIGGETTDEFDSGRFALNQAASKYLDPSIENIVNEYRYAPKSLGYLSSDFYIYDIATNTWEKSEVKFRERTGHSLNIYNDKIYVIGGIRQGTRSSKYLDDVIEVYDINSKNIEIDYSNPIQSNNLSTMLYDKYILAFGGFKKIKDNGSKVYAKKMYSYNLETGLWFEIGEMNRPKQTSAIVVNNKIYLIGGLNHKALNNIESFDLASGKWKTEGELFFRSEKPALAKKDHLIYIYENGKLVVFNTLSGVLNQYLINLRISSAKMFYDNDYLYILGGEVNKEFSVESSQNLYKIDINELRKTKINKSVVIGNNLVEN